MSSYIWFDSNGKEIKREDKGRGKPKAGAIRQENGDWHIYEGKPVTPVKVPEVATKESVVQKTEVNVEDKAVSVVNQKIFISSVRLNAYEMMKNLHISNGCLLEDEDFITIIRPDVTVETLGIPEFYCRYCSFARFLINKKDLSLSVWRMRTSGDPDYIVKDAFMPFE